MNLKPLRRRLSNQTRAHFPRLSARLNPGARMRLWDENWNLKADSDRNDFDWTNAVESDDYSQIVYEPATSLRLAR